MIAQIATSALCVYLIVNDHGTLGGWGFILTIVAPWGYEKIQSK